MDERFSEAAAKFGQLVEVMARLRAPGGCPWDRKQTFDSLKEYLLEETYEVMEAIDRRNWEDVTEELGDLLLQPVFLAELAREKELFSISDSLDAIYEKLIRRHPHIFGDAVAETPEDVKLRWDEIKRREKEQKGAARAESILDEVPRALPALMETEKISRKAAGAGFEWPDIGGVLEKLQEESAELAQARANGTAIDVEHEIGDVLFTVVNLARFLKVDAEQALRKANSRFRKRFAHVEQGITPGETSLERMEELWGEAKRLERST